MFIFNQSKPNWTLFSNPIDWQIELALRHKYLRKQKGYSQQEMASRSGVSLGSLKRFENTGQISLESFLILLRFLDRLEDIDALLKPAQDLDEIQQLFSDFKKK